MGTRISRQFYTSWYLLAAAALGACGGGGGGGAGGSGVPAPVAPAITSQPAPATVADGGTASFSVTASGDAPLAYQWLRNAAPLANGAGIAGATGNALTLTSPFTFDGSQISVSVSNAAGKIVSNTALLKVTAVAPSITQQPVNASVAAGVSASFTVKITGGTTPVTYQWKRGGIVIAGATAASYSITAPALADNAATFAVDVINPAGTLTSGAAILTVIGPSKSWGPATLISSGDTLRTPGNPQAVIDSAGNAIAVFQEGDAGNVRNAVWASRYPAGGAWAAAATIDNPVGNAVQPQIAITPNGVAVAVFSQSDVNTGGTLSVQSNRFAGAWGTVQTVNTPAITNATDPQVAVGPDGAATVVFDQAEGVGPRTWVNGSSAAGVFGTAGIVGGQFAFTPQVAVGANGQSVMVWQQVTGSAGNTYAFWASRNVGAGWTAAVQISAISTDLGSMRVAADAVGNAIAVWQGASSPRQAVFASRLDAASGAWSAARLLNDGTNYAYLPQLAVDSDGNMIVVWYEASDGAQSNGIVDVGVVANRFVAAAAAWSGAVAVQPAGPAGQAPEVAVDAAGNAIAVWLQQTPGNGSHYELWSAQYTAAGSAWAAPLKLMTDAAAYARIGNDPKIAVNATGDAVVVWYQQTDAPFALGIWTRVYR
jgi:hypothetical protein